MLSQTDIFRDLETSIQMIPIARKSDPVGSQASATKQNQGKRLSVAKRVLAVFKDLRGKGDYTRHELWSSYKIFFKSHGIDYTTMSRRISDLKGLGKIKAVSERACTKSDQPMDAFIWIKD